MAAPSYHSTHMIGSTDPAGDIISLVEVDLTAAGWTFVEETGFTQSSTNRVMRVWKNASTLNAAGTDFYIGLVRNAVRGGYLAMRAFEGYSTVAHTMTNACVQGLGNPAEQPFWKSLTYGNGQFVAVTNTASAGTSPDGYSWATRTLPGALSWSGVAAGPGVFVAVNATSGATSTQAASSTDGVTWTFRTTSASWAWYSVAYGAGLFCAVGNGAQAVTSPDGITWTTKTTTAAASSVAYGNGIWVCVGAAQAATTSYNTSSDTISWVGRTLPAAMSDVYYVNTQFIAVSRTVGVAALTSLDGTTWTSRTVPSGAYSAAAYGNGLYVITGNNVAATSPDGITWTARTVPTGNYSTIAFGNGQFVATGGNGSVSSPDGITWTAVGLAAAAPIAPGTTWAKDGSTTPPMVDTAVTLATNTIYDVGVLASKSYLVIGCNSGGTGTQTFAWVLGMYQPAYADTQSTTPPLMALSLPAAPGSASSGVFRVLRAGSELYSHSIAAGPETLLYGVFNAAIKEPASQAITGSRVALIAGTTPVGATIGMRGWLYDAIAVGTLSTTSVKIADAVTSGGTTYSCLGQGPVGANYLTPTAGACGYFFDTTAGS